MDNFKVVAKDLEIYIERIASVFLIKEHGPRNYYLGNDYTYHEEYDMWTYGISTYTKEAVAWVIGIYGRLSKVSMNLPTTDWHPETNTSPILNLDDYMKY